MKKFLAAFLILTLIASMFAGTVTAYADTPLEVYDLKTEYMENPVGIDRENPVFSWKIQKGTLRGVMQEKYEITVYDDKNIVVWNDVKTTDACNGIVYAGTPLVSGKEYTWNVKVTDNAGDTATSAKASFGVGLLGLADWNGAQWISSTGGSIAAATADPNVYSIECTFTVEYGSLGLIIGNPGGTWHLWQINADEGKADGELWFRPHNPGPAAGQEYNIPFMTRDEFLGSEHTVRVVVDNNKEWTYLDGRLITYGQPRKTTAARTEDYVEFNVGQIHSAGFRVFYGANDKDSLKINKLVIKDSLGKPVYYDDFASANSLTSGTVADGQLVLKPTANATWLAWPKAADNTVFSVQTDVQVGYQAAGLVFAAKDTSHFLMWQLNTFDLPTQGTPNADKHTSIRPHYWNPGGACIKEVDINHVLSKTDAESKMNLMRIDANNGVYTTYVNGVQVDQLTYTGLKEIGNIGFRMAQDQYSTSPEAGVFDNVMLRDTGGRVIYFEDFEDGVNRFGQGTVADGKMTIQKTGSSEVFLRSQEAAPVGSSKVPLMRKDFTTENKSIKRAVVYASALGHYELQLNGEKVGVDYMAPGWTEYATRVQYQSYDVTDQLNENGANSLGAMLAPGWYSGNISTLGNNRYGSTQALIANLVIEYADGSRQTVVTDGTWAYSMDGPIVETDMFDGETYNAAKEMGGSKYGWADPSYDNSDWGTVGVMYSDAYSAKTQGNTVKLTAQIGPTVKAMKEVTPVSITTDVNGKYTVDMGQNFAGILEMSLTGTAGSTAKIRYGEMLNDASGTGDGPQGTLYTANLRSAKATDYYTFKSNEKETWEPNFTFHGFQYVEISGVSKAPALSDIRGIALYSAMDETGTFDSSSELLNKIYENTFWGQRSNFLSIPTDCPQRDERMGWGADTLVFSGTGMYNMDAMMFYQKWLQDVRDGQQSNGAYLDTAPAPHVRGTDVVWGAGGVVVPYVLWQRSGDIRVLTDGYLSMKQYMAFRAAQGLIQSCGYGDWLYPEGGSGNNTVTGTTYYAYQLLLMEEIANALGYASDAAAYREQYEKVKAAFIAGYVNSTTGVINQNVQSSYILALGTGLTTPELEPLMVQNLVDKIAGDGGVMTVGFVSVNMLMPMLTKYGHSDVAYQLAMNTQYPSWGYSVEQGATTIWERWNSYTTAKGFGDVSMNSFNHYSFGSVCEWFYSGITGINADKTAPGFKNAVIKPALDSRLTYAGATYESIRGEIKSKWERTETGSVILSLTVPANSTATVVLPANTATVKEGGAPVLGGTPGVTVLDNASDPANAYLQVGSGVYSFEFDWEVPVSKTALSSAITLAENKLAIDGGIEEDGWTPDSAEALRLAIIDAKALLEDSTATQISVNNAVDVLNDAIKALVAGYSNLARGKAAAASSVVSGWPASRVTDGARSGNNATTWSSNNSTGSDHTEWIYIDLGTAQEFNRILIFPRNDPDAPAASGYGFPKDFTIDVCTGDPAVESNWTTVLARGGYPLTGTVVQRFTTEPTTARYVRVKGTSLNQNKGDNNSYRMQLAEIEIYNIPGASIGRSELGALIEAAEKLIEDDYTPETWDYFAQRLAEAKIVYNNPESDMTVTSTHFIALDSAMKYLEKPAVTAAANWIWEDAATTAANTWMAFRKEFTLDAAPDEKVIAQIAADSKYWMYINGELVVFEGSLKRGPNPQDTYVDNVDIAPYLKAGENNISILAWYFGKSGYSNTSSGKGGLYFDAKVGTQKIISNQSWKVKKYAAYGAHSISPNYRLPESSLLYNAETARTAGMESWFEPDYDDSGWAAAAVYGAKGTAPWNAFVDRPIPMFKYDEEFQVFDEANIKTTSIVTTSTVTNIPVSDYIIQTKLQVDKGAVGIVFGYQNDSNLKMWQINCADATLPILKPHIRSGGTWTVQDPRPTISGVTAAEKLTHEYEVTLKIQGGTITTIVDGNVIDTRAVSGTTGGVGFRSDSAEHGYIDYLKVTSIDGETVYVDADMSVLNFTNGTIANGRLSHGSSGSEFAIHATGITATRYECRLPTNFQFTPYLKVNADAAGKTVEIYTDKTSVADGPALRAGYITKAGVQEYESLGWLNGDKLFFEVPEGVEVLELGYRQSGYNAEFDGSFESDDEFLNTLWIKSRDTLYVTMRDNYMDCPDRERAQWWGDAVNEMQMAFYALSTDANLLAKKGIGNVHGYVKDGVIPTVAPIQAGDFMELPAQSLAGIMSYYMYYEYTGDAELLANGYSVAKTYLLDKFNMGIDDVVQHRNGQWNWSDWGNYSDQKLITNCWYYIALDRTIKMAEVTGIDMNSADVAALKARKASIEQNFDKVFWNAGGFYRTPGVTTTDDRGNALAVYSGLAPVSKYPQIKNILTTIKHSSPYMEKYALEALYIMGYENEALARMKDRYADMVASDYTTLWEFWNPTSGTQNHAWTGGPLTMMSMYATGVSPIEPGYMKFKVAPQAGTIKTINTVIPTVKGDISVNIDGEISGRFALSVTVPDGTTALVGVPLTGGKDATTVEYNGEVIWQNGADIPDAAVRSVIVPQNYADGDKFVFFEVAEDSTFVATRGEISQLSIDVNNRENVFLKVNGEAKAMPYTHLFAKDTEVEITFESKYAGEYGIASIDGVELADETAMAYTLTLDQDYDLKVNAAYIGPENLALNKAVTVTHALAANNNTAWGANNLTDGLRTGAADKNGFTTTDITTENCASDPRIITIDLGSVMEIDEVYFYPRTDAVTVDGKHPSYPKDFTISVSTDGVEYTVVKTVENEIVTQDRRGEYTFDAVAAQYVRITVTKMGMPASDEGGAISRYRVQLTEIEVYGPAAAMYTVTILESENGTVTADKGEVAESGSVIFTVTADEGYELDTLYINDEPVTVSDNRYTVSDVAEDIVAYATFKEIFVPVEVTGVKINSVATTMVRKNKTLQLNPIFTPSNANVGTKVTWSSSNTAAVTVSENGLITGIKAGGSARVTVTTENGKTYTITVTVDS